MNNIDIEALISTCSEAIKEAVHEEAARAASEEDVRHHFNTEIDRFIRDADLQFRGRHEYGLAGGAIDSKYSGVIIEYKNPSGPKKLTASRKSPGCQEVLDQIRDRFDDFEAQYKVVWRYIASGGARPKAARRSARSGRSGSPSPARLLDQALEHVRALQPAPMLLRQH